MDIVIGDIQGCFDELMDLLDKIGPAEGDQIISVGDMVDCGPKSPEVVTFFMKEENAASVMGNHERKHWRCAKGLMDMRNFGNNQKKTVRQFEERGGRNGVVTYAEALFFFEALPLFLDLPEAIIVHAGLIHGIALPEQNEKILTGAGFQKENAPNKKTGLFNWCDSYPRGAKPVIFGHLGVGMAPWTLPQRENLWPLDSGCASGGYLTAVALPYFRIYQVKSKQPPRLKRRRQ